MSPAVSSDMFEAVYAAPDDDVPRERLAEHLTKSGDPRGELITLQLATARGDASPKAAKKIASLLKKHGKTWIEPLEGSLVASSVAWERGFPVAGALAMRKPADQKRITHGPNALSTLRRLSLGKSESGFQIDWLRRFLFTSPLRGLRELTGLWQELVADIALSDKPWSLESVDTLSWNESSPTVIANAFAQGRGLPHLTRLDIILSGGGVAHHSWLVTTDVGRQLRTLAIGSAWWHLLSEWHAQLVAWGDKVALDTLVIGKQHAISGRDFDWVALHRTPAGWTRLTGIVGHPAVGPPGPTRNKIREGGLMQLRTELGKLPNGAITEDTITWLPAP